MRQLPFHVIENIRLYNPVPKEVLDRQAKLRAARERTQELFNNYSAAFELFSPEYDYFVSRLTAVPMYISN